MGRLRFGISLCLFVLCAFVFIAAPQSRNIYHGNWIDLNKNGRTDPYEDPSVPVERRIDNLLSLMNVDEKTAQLATLYGYGRVLMDELPTPKWKQVIWKDGIANIDEHLNGVVNAGVVKSKLALPFSTHAESINTVQRFFVEETRLGIPVDFTNEGIRGLTHPKATSFPSQPRVIYPAAK
jgi:beta-glucosidase